VLQNDIFFWVAQYWSIWISCDTELTITITITITKRSSVIMPRFNFRVDTLCM